MPYCRQLKRTLEVLKCQISDTVVINSRDHGDYIRRRRKCLKCGARQTTYERYERVESKRDLLEENAKRVAEYRKYYPKDKRPDENILRALIKMNDVSHTKLVHGFVWLEGQLNG